MIRRHGRRRTLAAVTRKEREMYRRLLPALAAVLAMSIVSGCVGRTTDRSRNESAEATGAAAAAATAGIPSIVRKLEPSIVTVYVGQGLGSGIVYKADGVIVTNQHVVGDAKQVAVGFADGQRVAGEVLATDPVTDLAVVRVSRTGLPAARFETRLPAVGELAIALGSPLGFANSATAGIVSGLGRAIPAEGAQGQPLVDLIQTDAAISPGNSGGALVNGAAAVIGVNEAYIPPASGAVSLGFAIPSATVVSVVDQLLRGGRAQHAYLGVEPTTLTPDIAQQLGIEPTGGVVVQALGQGGPAAAAGIRPGDIIVSIGETKTPTTSELYEALRDHKPGDKVDVRVIRDGAEQPVTVTLGDRPS
jgi:serine protease DegQ